MAKFKKVAMLSMALLMTASFVGCDLINGLLLSESSESSEVTSEATSEDVGTSEDLGTSEDVGTSEEEAEPTYLYRGENTVSIAAGETVDLQLAVPGLILGAELGLTWTSENAKVIVDGEVVEGTYATLVITPMFSLAVSTVNGEAEDIVLTIGEAKKEESPTVTLGENTVEISANDAMWGKEFTFTASETAMYSFSTEDENACISWGTVDGISSDYVSVGYTSNVGLAAGDILIVTISTNNSEADTIELTIVQTGTYNPYALSVGTNYLKAKKTEDGVSGTYTFVAPNTGTYAISSSSSVDPTTASEEDLVLSAITYTANETTAYLTDSIVLLTLNEGDEVSFIGYAYHEYAYMDGVCSLDLSISAVALDGVAFTFNIVDGEASVCFYAEEAATYTFTITEGAKVMDYSMEVWDFVEITSIPVEEGKTLVYLTIKSDTLTEATITLVKAK